MGEDDDIGWNSLPLEVRQAIIQNAKSQLWWKGLGTRVKGLTPLTAAILSLAALWQLFGEVLQRWLHSGS